MDLKLKPHPVPGSCPEMAFTLSGRGSSFSEKLGNPVVGHSRCLPVNICGQSGGVLHLDLAKYTKPCKWLLNIVCPATKSSVPVRYLMWERQECYLIKISCSLFQYVGCV